VADEVYGRVYEALRKLGDTSDQIAYALTERGIRGRRMEERSCPLANYLRAEVGVETQVENGSIQVDGTSGFMSTGVLPGVEDFIDDFDNRAYPYLIQEPPA
jgi:hypothetical protein